MTDIITQERTWSRFGDDGLAEQIIGVQAGSDVTLAFDLTQVLNPDTSLSSPSVTEVSTADLTIDTPAVDGYKVEVQATGFVAETVYTLKLSVSASDTTGTDTLILLAKVEAY